MTLDDRTTRALASTVALLTPAQYAELHLRVTLELRAERERCAAAIEAAATKERAAADDAGNVIAHEYHMDRYAGLLDAVEIVRGLR